MTTNQTNSGDTAFGPSILITATRVPDHERAQFLPRFFGRRLMMTGESLIYSWMRELAPEYNGGFWHFYTLSNNAYYMAPALDCKTLHICCSGNFYNGHMSPDAAGIVATLYALNRLAWRTRDERLSDLFYSLRDYAREHAEGPEIFGAID